MAVGLKRIIATKLFGYRPRVGDVVLDLYGRQLKTVEVVSPGRVATAHFEGNQLKRGSLMTRSVRLVS